MSTHSSAKSSSGARAPKAGASGKKLTPKQQQKAAETERAQRDSERRAQAMVARLGQDRHAYRYQAQTLPDEHLSAEIRSTLEEWARRTAPGMAESRIIVDRGSGHALLDLHGREIKQYGDMSGVNLRRDHTAEYPQGQRMVARGQIDFHTHPFVDYSSPTINDWDYEEASRWVKPGMIGAVTERGVAMIVPPGGVGGRWPSYATTVRPALDRNFHALDTALRSYAMTHGTRAGWMDRLTTGDIEHLAWILTAEQTGLTYMRVPLSAVGIRGRGGAPRIEKPKE